MPGRRPRGTFRFWKAPDYSPTKGRAGFGCIVSSGSDWRWLATGWRTFNVRSDFAREEIKMSATKGPVRVTAKPSKREAPDDTPQFFRLNVEVGSLDTAAAFYSKLLGVQG